MPARDALTAAMAFLCLLSPAAAGAAAPAGRPLQPAGPPAEEEEEARPPAPPLRAEDGGPLPARRSLAPFRDGLHPVLWPATADPQPVAVYVLLERDDGAGVEAELRRRRNTHLPAILDVGRRIQEIEAPYRLRGPQDPGDAEPGTAPRLDLTQEEAARRRRLQEEADRLLDGMRRDLADVLGAGGRDAREAVAGDVERLGGRVLRSVRLGNLLRVDLPGTGLEDLARHPRVRRILPVTEGEPQLSVSVPSARFDEWHFNGLDGGVYDVGVADSGIQEDHPAFAGINFYTNEASPTDPDGHGTHVGGIIFNNSSFYRGTAYGLDAVIWGQAGGFAFATMDYAVTTAGQTPEVFNMSWGYSQANVEDYNFEDEWFDTYIEAFFVPISFAAGNNGWSDSEPKLNHPTAGYNSITVANMNDMNNLDRRNDVRSGDSSVGPTLSGRRKPDLAAPGSAIVSTHAFWSGSGSAGGGCKDPTNDNDFSICSGTSMAAPHVAGAVVLLNESGVFDAMAQKAILINTADWWDSNDTEDTGDDARVTLPPFTGDTMWDKSYGWGYLNMFGAYVHRADYFLGSLVPRNDNAVEDDYKLYRGHLDPGEKVTLVWQKRGSYDPDKFSASTYALSDLNLRAYSESSGAAIDSDLVGIDNVHQVAALSDTDVVVKVYSWSTLFDGASTEDFAVATQSGFQEVSFPDQFQAFALWPVEVEPNELFDVEFWVRNDGEAASFLNTFDLSLPPGFVLVSGADPQNGGTIAAGDDSFHAVWTIRAPAAPVAGASIEVSHSHSSYDETYGPFAWAVNLDVQWDVTPPSPDPLTWSLPPADVSTTQIQMAASLASDLHGVEYYFDFILSLTGGLGGSDSSWQTSTIYTDASLGVNHQYCYRAYARDGSQGLNATGFTPTVCEYTAIEASTGVDLTTVTASSIRARSLNTPSGLGRGSSGLILYNDTLANDTGWNQTNDEWVWSNLTPNTAYAFRAQTRNGDAEATPATAPLTRYTLAVDPVPLGFGGFGPDTISVDLDPADANPAGTTYLFENTTTRQVSGWSSATRWVNGSLECATTYSYRAKARNGDSVETGWVSLGNASTPIDQDDDADGSALCQGDCDDGDPTVYPGAAEVCDGRDNDCNGLVDDGLPDADGDGYDACADCDDSNELIHPGVADVCDGLDNDCDGIVDDGDPDGDGSPSCSDLDDDGDGVRDVEDCLPLDATSWRIPADTTLTLGQSLDLTTLSWSESPEPGTRFPVLYDVVLSPVAGDWGDPADCVIADTGGLQATHGFLPSPGSVYNFLVVARNACGGNSGAASAGPRTLVACP